jgi:hypothetical protein
VMGGGEIEREERADRTERGVDGEQRPRATVHDAHANE